MNTNFPWENVAEDRWAANDAIYTLYSSLQLAKPRIAWAPSPRSMFIASRLLRTVQSGTAHSMVQSLVPQDPDRIGREARISLLTAMLDPDVTTQSGGLLIRMFHDVFGTPVGYPLAIEEMRQIMRFAEPDPNTSTPATFYEQAMYPAMYPAFSASRLAVLPRQALVMMPFTKLCWLSRPPLYTRVNEFGHLHAVNAPAVEWADGFCLYVDRTEDENGRILHEPKYGTLYISSQDTPQLGDGSHSVSSK